MAPPAILELLAKEFHETLYDVKWVPQSPRLVVLGTYAAGTGTLQVVELEGTEGKVVGQGRAAQGLRCGAIAASAGQLAAGGFGGALTIWDLERPDNPVVEVEAHEGVVHSVHSLGGSQGGGGAPEVATGGQDGWVRVWDARQPRKPAAAFLPPSGAGPVRLQRECWSVALGNSPGDGGERCVLAGHAGGELQLLDVRGGTQRWAANLGKGVCSVQFDRPDISMNKFVAACLDSQLCVFDARTKHPANGFARLTQRLPAGATLWSVRHLPQNRDVCMVAAGDGSLSLHRYSYPDQRSVLDVASGQQEGVAGSLACVCDKVVSGQPVAAFEWCADKAGLWACVAYDQYLRVGQVARVSSL